MLNSLPLWQPFRVGACCSYLVGDSGHALVVDPHRELVEDYQEFAGSHGLRITSAIDTHLHDEHLSGNAWLKASVGCEVVGSHKNASKRVTRRLNEGEIWSVGKLKFKMLETPGHMPDSTAWVGEGLAFTGDSLWIGSLGPIENDLGNVELLWESHQKLKAILEDRTFVLPAHEFEGVLFSNVKAEKLRSREFEMDRKSFLESRKEEPRPPSMADRKRLMEANLTDDPGTTVPIQHRPELLLHRTRALQPGKRIFDNPQCRWSTISINKFAEKMLQGPKAEGDLYIDVREKWEFDEGHIPGMKNIPLAELIRHVDEILQSPRVYFSCLSARRSELATKTFSYLGHSNAVNVLGSYRAYIQQGYPPEKPKPT